MSRFACHRTPSRTLGARNTTWKHDAGPSETGQRRFKAHKCKRRKGAGERSGQEAGENAAECSVAEIRSERTVEGVARHGVRTVPGSGCSAFVSLREQRRPLSSRTMAWLGKLLFRRSQRYEQRRKLRVLMATVSVGLLVAAALAAVLYWAAVHGMH